jgi:biotin operon repressor
MNAQERKALEILCDSGTEVQSGSRNAKATQTSRPAVNEQAAESLVEQGYAYHRELKGKQPGYVASVEGRRALSDGEDD